MKRMRLVWILATWILLIGLSAVYALEIGQNYEKDCSSGRCTASIYSYQKYYQSNGAWTFLNESIDTTNCKGFTYCVDNNLHQFYLSPSSLTPNVTVYDGSFAIGLSSLAGKSSFAKSLTIEGSTATYKDILPGISLKYQYLAHELKEQLIIDSAPSILSQLPGNGPLTLLFQLDSTYGYTTSNAGVSITKNGKTISHILPVIIYDNETNFIGAFPYTISTFSNAQYLTVEIPTSNFTNPAIHYPLFIDPTFLTNATASEDYHVTEALGTYTRDDSIENLPLGRGQADLSNPVWTRGAWNFNLSMIPQNATMTEAYFNVTVWGIGNKGNEVIEFHHLASNLSSFPDNPAGNMNLSIDAGDGTIYNLTNVSLLGTGSHTLNFSPALPYLQNVFGEFSFGAMTKGESATGNQLRTKTRPSEYSVAAERPVFIIRYTLPAANESEGDAAITQGILNILPNATIYSEQQAYTRNATGVQQLGRFDRFAVFGSQRWAFNYITAGESFTNMSNLSQTFFVLEITDLTTSQITQQVEQFINGTKS